MRKEGWGGERSRIVVRFSTCAMALRAGNTGKKGRWFAGVVFIVMRVGYEKNVRER